MARLLLRSVGSTPAQSVRLTKFHVKAYRSCKDTTLRPSSTLTALIGPNSSGKTNLLQALLLLAKTNSVRFWSSEEQIFSRFSNIESEFQVGNATVRLKTRVEYKTDDANRDEVLGRTERWCVRHSKTSKFSAWFSTSPSEAHVRGIRIGTSGRYIYDYAPSTRASQRRARSRDLGVFEQVERFRNNINYYSASQFTRPSLCPTSFETDENGSLRPETFSKAKDHTQFIYELYRAFKRGSSQYEMYLSLVDRRGMTLIDGIRWKEVRISSPAYEVRTGGEVIKKSGQRIVVVPIIDIAGAALSFNQLSEGTLRTLAMLYYITNDSSELLLLEEPEVCVHHGLLDSVIEVIKSFSARKQVLFSTHSELVLDKLEPEDVVLVSRQRGAGTNAQRLDKDLSNKSLRALRRYLESSGNLGEYWRHSGFDK